MIYFLCEYVIYERMSFLKFKFYHTNINVFDLEKSLTFYKESLGLIEVKRKESEDGSFILVC